MRLDERLKLTGQWLFKYRSGMYVALVPVFLAAVALEWNNFTYTFSSPIGECLYIAACALICFAGEFL